MDAVEGVCLGKVRYAGMKRLDYWIDFDPSGLIKYEKSGLHGCKAVGCLSKSSGLGGARFYFGTLRNSSVRRNIIRSIIQQNSSLSINFYHISTNLSDLCRNLFVTIVFLCRVI